MSKLRTNIIENQSGSTITIGKSGTNVALAAGATQTGFGGDLTPLQNDMSVLALHQAINSNQTAHGLQNSWIEQFEDSSAITGLSTAYRHDDEYMASGSISATPWPYTNYADQVFTHNNFSDIDYFNGLSTTHTVAGNTDSTMLAWAPSPSGFTSYINFDYLANYNFTGLRVGFRNSHGHINTWRIETSTDGSAYSILDMTGATSSALTGYDLDNTNNLAITTDSTGLVTNTVNGGSSPHDHGGQIVFGTPVTTRHLRITIGSFITNGNANSGIDFFVPIYSVHSITSTGSFTSTTITPQDSASKSSLGLVLLYKDNAGTNALNTDIVAQVSADNGVNYTDCVLASRGTFSTGIKTAIAPAVDVTSGNQLKYKISFANQASGSKEARVYGVSLQY